MDVPPPPSPPERSATPSLSMRLWRGFRQLPGWAQILIVLVVVGIVASPFVDDPKPLPSTAPPTTTVTTPASTLLAPPSTQPVVPPPTTFDVTTTSPPTTPATTLALDGAEGQVTGYVPVVDVVDGDTIKVIEGGEKTTIRIIGIDTPETKHPRKPVQCFGPQASQRASQLLTGQQVRLEFDPSQGRVDRYGRTLAYVHLSNGSLFEEVMISEGYAHEYTYRSEYRYQSRFRQAETTARTHDRGLWSSSTCDGDTEQPAA